LTESELVRTILVFSGLVLTVAVLGFLVFMRYGTAEHERRRPKD
jgi:hypothetical protein